MDYIKIAGYKSIKKQKIELNPINILIGANGSGKSNFISFFDFLNRIYNKKINDYIALSGGANKILHKGQKFTEEISFKIEFDKGNNAYAATLKAGVDNFIFIKELLIYQDDEIDISRSKKETRLGKATVYRAKYIRELTYSSTNSKVYFLMKLIFFTNKFLKMS